MSEHLMRREVVKALQPLDAFSVENPVYPGTPDVNYVEGWLELKYADKWPERPSTPLKLPHFTPQQRIWLLRRWRAGGNAFLLLHVHRQEWLLFAGDVAQAVVGRVAKDALLFHAIKVWPSLNQDELIRALRRI